MKIVLKVADAVTLARRFQDSPAEAMRSLVGEMQVAFASTLERVMDAEVALFLGEPAEKDNKRNGYTARTYAIGRVGTVQVRVPRDRTGHYESSVVPRGRRYDETLEQDIALLHPAGFSTRMLATPSKRVLGVSVSAQEVSNALHRIVPEAKAFLSRSLAERRFKYLCVDGTNFHIRRTTVDLRLNALTDTLVDKFRRPRCRNPENTAWISLCARLRLPGDALHCPDDEIIRV